MVIQFVLFHLIHTKWQRTRFEKVRKNPDKDPVPKPGNGSAVNKQLTGQLWTMYLPFLFTFAAFIISPPAVEGNWVMQLFKTGCIFHRMQNVVEARWCYQTKHRFSCKFRWLPTGWCRMYALLFVAGALKPLAPACRCRYRWHLWNWSWWWRHQCEGTWLTLHLNIKGSIFCSLLRHKISFRISLADTQTINHLTATTSIS